MKTAIPFGMAVCCYDLFIQRNHAKKSGRTFNLKVSKKPETINSGILKGCYPFSGFQRQSLWWGVGQSPTYSLISAQQRVNFKTVRWTVLKEGTPCKRGRSLIFNKLRRTIRSAFNYALKLTKNYLYLVYVSKLIGRYVIAFNLFTVKCEFLYAALYVCGIVDADVKLLAAEVLLYSESVP